MTEEGLIKISLNGERFWVEDLGEGRYKVRNVTIMNDFGFLDIIDIKGNILEAYGRSAILKYTVKEDEDIEEVFPKVVKYFEDTHGILIEGFTYGRAGLTMPNTMSDEEVLKIAEDCEFECILEFKPQD